jgi:chorismate dehydratase
MSVAVGEITYTNIMPLYYYVNRQKLANEGVSFVPQVPSKLNQQMKDGIIDVGAISSFAYGENFKDYELLPDMSVSSQGKVGSIFLFSTKPIDLLNGSNIALTSSSASSVHLLKVIFKEFYSYQINYETMKPNLHLMLQNNDACLLIGDDAIQALWNAPSHLFVYDLGELWTNFTGLPMTFAVVAVRKEKLIEERNTIDYLYQEMLNSKEMILKDGFVPMIKDIKQLLPGSYAFWEQYFKGLSYHLHEKHKSGLKYYYELNYKYGFINQIPKLSFTRDYVKSHSM